MNTNTLPLNENINNDNITFVANEVNPVNDKKAATTSMTVNVTNTDNNNNNESVNSSDK